MARTMIITRGIPASGKTTWAKQWVSEAPYGERVNVNRDDIRKMMGFGQVGTNEQEDSVTTIQNSMIHAVMSDGKDIVISDTNMRRKNIARFAEMGIVAGYEVKVKDFPIDFDTAVARDKNREDSVGEDVIRKFHSKFPPKQWIDGEKIISEVRQKVEQKEKRESYRNNPDNPDAIMVDIDGTIAINDGHRSYYDYSDAVKGDKPNTPVIEAVKMAHAAGVKIIIMSGREDRCKEASIEWMTDNGIPFDEVHFRATGDQRPDWIVKDEMVREHIQDSYHVVFCYDDRDQVVSHHRKMGYKVFQVAPGDF